MVINQKKPAALALKSGEASVIGEFVGPVIIFITPWLIVGRV
jgi:hypothetical protein